MTICRTKDFIPISQDILDGKQPGKPLLLALSGELGSGKTTFTQYLAKELGIKENIISPTFILHREYDIPAGSKLHHIDLYRLNEIEEFNELNLNGLLTASNVIVIEWADKFKEEIKSLESVNNTKIIWMEFSHLSETKREVQVIKQL